MINAASKSINPQAGGPKMQLYAGESKGQTSKRTALVRLIGDLAQDFDIAHLHCMEDLLTDEARGACLGPSIFCDEDLSQDGFGDDVCHRAAAMAVNDLYRRIVPPYRKKFLPQRSQDITLRCRGHVQDLISLFQDLRPQLLTNRQMELALQAETCLGFTRAGVHPGLKELSMEEVKRKAIDAKVWREDYEEADEHAVRSQMLLLFDHLVEALDCAEQEPKAKGATISKESTAKLTLVEKLGFIRLHKLDHQLVQVGVDAEDLNDEQFLLDMYSDEIEEVVERFAVAQEYKVLQERHRISPEYVHKSLPPISGLPGKLSSDGIVRTETESICRRTSEVEGSGCKVVELGLRIDGYYTWGEYIAADDAYQLLWDRSNSPGCLKAFKLDSLLHSCPADNRTRLKDLVLHTTDGAIFRLDVTRWEIKDAVANRCVQCEPLDMMDDFGVPFRRMVLSIKEGWHFDHLRSNVLQHKVSESGDVLAKIFTLHHRHRSCHSITGLDLSPSILAFASNHLVSTAFPDIHAALDGLWSQLLELSWLTLCYTLPIHFFSIGTCFFCSAQLWRISNPYGSACYYSFFVIFRSPADCLPVQALPMPAHIVA